MIEVREYVTDIDIINLFENKKTDMYKYIYTIFHSISIDFQEVLIKKYSSYPKLRDEIIQKASLQLLEAKNNLKKESLYFSLMNYLKYNLFNETKYSTSKEVYDFEVVSESGKTFIETYAHNGYSIEDKVIIRERETCYRSLVASLENLLSKEEREIIRLKFFEENEFSFEEIANRLEKPKETIYKMYSNTLDKMREYYIINYFDLIKELINPKHSAIKHHNGWTIEELNYVLDNHGLKTDKEMMRYLNNGRHNQITYNAYRDAITKLGLTKSTKSQCSSDTINDLIKNQDDLKFTFYEDNVISKYFNKIDESKLLAIVNLKRAEKVNWADIEKRYSQLKKINKEKYMKRKQRELLRYENN